MFDFITSKSKNCGVYQFGFRLNQILLSQGSNHNYYECNDYSEFAKIESKSKIILFNFMNARRDTAPLKWLNRNILLNLKKNGHIVGVIDHLNDVKYDFDFIVHHNPYIFSKNNLTIPRPLYYDIKNVPFDIVKPTNINVLKKRKLIFGSFGLAFKNKGFDKIIKKINSEFDNALIRMHIIIANSL